MIYVDTSVVLAEILSEDTRPHPSFWEGQLLSSRLAEYEVHVRLHAYGSAAHHRDYARAVLGRLAIVELTTPALERALEPFPRPVRTLDALHLATCVFVRSRAPRLALATYDARLAEAGRALGLEVVTPEAAR